MSMLVDHNQYICMETYRFSTIWAMIWCVGENKVAISTLRRLETHVVVTRSIVLAEAELRGRGKEARVFLLWRKEKDD